jgi:phosphatidylglycerol:prolipoprotein diacylglycerol transferase
MSGWLFCRKKQIDFWKAADFYVATIPIGIGLGRIGNFINGELYGRFTHLPWGVVFPDGGRLPRHPSQLYESLLEGVVLFLLLWTLRRKPWNHDQYWPHGSILALFLCGYGCMRIFVEIFREPDPQLGYFFGSLTMGQLLSTAMIVCGLLVWKFRLPSQNCNPQ